MLTNNLVNLIVLLPVLINLTWADYGLDDVSNYRLNDEMKKYPVKSPDDLFGFEVPAGLTELKAQPNPNKLNHQQQNYQTNNQQNYQDNNQPNYQDKNQQNYQAINNQQNYQDNNNQQGYNYDPYNNYLDQNNVLKPKKKSPPKKVRKPNRVKTPAYGRRPPVLAKPPVKMIFSQYMSPHVLESSEAYPANPTDTFNDPFFSQLMPHIMATAEQMAEKQVESVRPYRPVIPNLLEFLKSSPYFDVETDEDDPYGVKRSDQQYNRQKY